MLLTCFAGKAMAQDYSKYYQNLPTPMAQVTTPVIPDASLSLTEVGGVGDGVTLNTEAFKKGISKLSKQGGGHLNVPAGIWLTGPIMLKSGIDLHLDKNAAAMPAFAPRSRRTSPLPARESSTATVPSGAP